MRAWYTIENESAVDSPALLVYPDRIKENISLAKDLAQEVSRLRPHVKTHKMREVTEMLLAAGISKFKCATIAEAEMLALAGAKDVLLAYQPTQPKANRLISLIHAFPHVHFSCLVDNGATGRHLSAGFEGQQVSVYIDLNVGMNRTGIRPSEALSLLQQLQAFGNIAVIGLHAYDGHIHDLDLERRKQQADDVLAQVLETKERMEAVAGRKIKLVMGGTPTFHLYAQQEEVETSPGTFVFWDEGYRVTLPDLPFALAAVLLVRVISKIDAHTLCLDVGHKAVAAENPLPRITFLNMPAATPLSQSEEHLVVRVPDTAAHEIGEVWYGVPTHICPTVALYEAVQVVENHRYVGRWPVIARNRILTI
ncbi:D-TA family PLP-dependent enzyme [soil metagenome]